MFKLFIFLVIVEREDGHCIIELEREGISSIVNEEDVSETSVADYSEIFHVHSIVCLHAVLSEQSVANPLSLRIELIDHDVCIATVAGCEYNNLKLLR